MPVLLPHGLWCWPAVPARVWQGLCVLHLVRGWFTQNMFYLCRHVSFCCLGMSCCIFSIWCMSDSNLKRHLTFISPDCKCKNAFCVNIYHLYIKFVCFVFICVHFLPLLHCLRVFFTRLFARQVPKQLKAVHQSLLLTWTQASSCRQLFRVHTCHCWGKGERTRYWSQTLYPQFSALYIKHSCSHAHTVFTAQLDLIHLWTPCEYMTGTV